MCHAEVCFSSAEALTLRRTTPCAPTPLCREGSQTGCCHLFSVASKGEKRRMTCRDNDVRATMSPPNNTSWSPPHLSAAKHLPQGHCLLPLLHCKAATQGPGPQEGGPWGQRLPCALWEGALVGEGEAKWGPHGLGWPAAVGQSSGFSNRNSARPLQVGAESDPDWVGASCILILY